MKKSKAIWNTYLTVGYTYDVANDQRSAGGVHRHQVRRTAKKWQKRICQSNGNFISYSKVENLSDAEGTEKFNLVKGE